MENEDVLAEILLAGGSPGRPDSALLPPGFGDLCCVAFATLGDRSFMRGGVTIGLVLLRWVFKPAARWRSKVAACLT